MSGRNAHFSSGRMVGSSSPMQHDSGKGTGTSIGSKLGMSQTPANGGGGFNIGGMIGNGGGGIWQRNK